MLYISQKKKKIFEVDTYFDLYLGTSCLSSIRDKTENLN